MKEKEFNILEAEQERGDKMNERSRMYGNVKMKKEGYEYEIKGKIRRDNNFSQFISYIEVEFYDNEIQFRMTQYGTHAGSFKYRFARKDDIDGYDRKKVEKFVLENKIELGDVYKFEGPGTGANLLEHVKTSSIVDYIDVLRYFAKEFEERGELIQMIKGFYLKYYNDMDKIREIESELSVLDYHIRKHYIALYAQEVINEKLIETGNIIVCHIAKDDFVTFESYTIEKAARINVKYHLSSTMIDRKYDFDDGSSTYFLRTESRDLYRRASDTKRDSMINSMVSHKMAGNKIQVYTQDEYDAYLMLIKTEADNILKFKKDKNYNKISEHYGKIKERK